MATMTMDFGGGRIVGTKTPLVLTERGRAAVRLLVGILAAVLALAVFSFGKDVAVAALTSTSAAPATSHTIVVKPGETLWQIASRELPGTDTRDAVARIRTLNALDGRSVQAGQEIAIPVG